ncbi:MAG: quinate 5-dehydrogenase [Chloroflexi bacterium]|nr:MAG: quinate 5-dehydrogenase [Chloroflexota bacterium]MBL1195728.1 quinate 5-dehydrogenase [Chloroflexota bacterium]NOH13016.1 quinate 5-dehydrogenase [Chloroflexota bacterium]
MKRAVSVSIGSSKRNKKVEVELLGEKISIERIGMDGDMEKAAQLYKELDGTVDAFGVGGADLGLMVDGKWYTLHSVKPMVRFIEKTPVVDGTGLKNTLENRAIPYLHQQVGDYVDQMGKKAFVSTGADRWGITASLVEAEYDVVYGDLMFGLDIPIPLRSHTAVKRAAAIVMPIAGRMPFEMLYPTGEKQEKREPKWEKYYAWATVISGDFHFVKGSMPDEMGGKVILTNTTTPEDVELLRSLGVKYLLTTTPVLDGRSFGTNMMEAALVAVAGKGRKLSNDELNELIDQLGFEPQLQELN